VSDHIGFGSGIVWPGLPSTMAYYRALRFIESA
jgi:hypothetical protein